MDLSSCVRCLSLNYAKKLGNRLRMLIIDGHSSHITSNMIALCIKNNTDLLILPPYCSHLL